ncbi:hypothetical protein MJ581_15340 [Escherichia coli]|nr:hypothetical protein MJ581_15340 [Escherichia coli]
MKIELKITINLTTSYTTNSDSASPPIMIGACGDHHQQKQLVPCKDTDQTVRRHVRERKRAAAPAGVKAHRCGLFR